LIDIYEQQEQWEDAASQHDRFDRGSVITKDDYFEQRKQHLAGSPYGPFGVLMNQAILTSRLQTIDDAILSELSESQSPMFPLLLAVHPAFHATRLLPRAREFFLPAGTV
jgi:hypothetical protein